MPFPKPIPVPRTKKPISSPRIENRTTVDNIDKNWLKTKQSVILKFFSSQKKKTKLKELQILYENAIYICISWSSNIYWFLVENW